MNHESDFTIRYSSHSFYTTDLISDQASTQIHPKVSQSWEQDSQVWSLTVVYFSTLFDLFVVSFRNFFLLLYFVPPSTCYKMFWYVFGSDGTDGACNSIDNCNYRKWVGYLSSGRMNIINYDSIMNTNYSHNSNKIK